MPNLCPGRCAKDLGAKCPNAELQAAHDAALSVGAGVARIAQDEDVARHGIKHRLQRSSGVGAANNGGQRCLSFLHQCLPHAIGDVASQGLTSDKAFVAILQDLQGFYGRHGTIGGGAHGQSLDRRWQREVRRQHLGLSWGMTQELHTASFKVVDAALDLQISSATC